MQDFISVNMFLFSKLVVITTSLGIPLETMMYSFFRENDVFSTCTKNMPWGIILTVVWYKITNFKQFVEFIAILLENGLKQLHIKDNGYYSNNQFTSLLQKQYMVDTKAPWNENHLSVYLTWKQILLTYYNYY